MTKNIMFFPLQKLLSFDRPGNVRRWIIIISSLIVSLFITSKSLAALPESVNAVYIPSHGYTERKVSELIHYAKLTKMNAVVLHVKDPYGKLNWKSQNDMAVEIGASEPNGTLNKAVRRFKEAGIWTIAKIDIFADNRLVDEYPEMGIIDSSSGEPWKDKNGLHWANPYDCNVWEYNIALCKELAGLGFDEIQFDYIRFPCDGDLKKISFPMMSDDMTKAECIGRFLETARLELKPLGVAISIDIFGVAAWKKEDFGVGQVLENMAPHVDVVCPMLYPSHFSKDFLILSNSGNYPRDIMELSMERLKKRTDIRIRPWIQGFWYPKEKINAQIDGILNAGTSSWAVWNPVGNYSTTYLALSQRMDTELPEPQFYPSLNEITEKERLVSKGNFRVVNLTNYKEGFTILSLEESKNGKKSSFSTLMSVVSTMDEGIMDHILTQRDISFSKKTSRHYKKKLIAELLSKDLDIDLRRLRPMPIYIDWNDNCLFTKTLTQEHIELYRNPQGQLHASL